MKALFVLFLVSSILTAKDRPVWEVTPLFIKNTDNSLGETLRHEDINYLNQYAIGVNVGRNIVEDYKELPLDFTWTVGTIWHNERGAGDNFLQHTVLFKGAWKSFPWNSVLRTRLEIGTGASFTWRISEAEKQNRSGKDSRNLLNYNEFSLGFNLYDLTGKNFTSLEKSWLMTGIVHRSGAWGFWGSARNEDGVKEPVEGAWNAYYLGIKIQF